MNGVDPASAAVRAPFNVNELEPKALFPLVQPRDGVDTARSQPASCDEANEVKQGLWIGRDCRASFNDLAPTPRAYRPRRLAWEHMGNQRMLCRMNSLNSDPKYFTNTSGLNFSKKLATLRRVPPANQIAL